MYSVEMKKGFHALIAAMSGAVPRICIARFMLYASTCKLISVLTRGRRLDASDMIASFNLGECSGAGTTDRGSPGPSRHCTRERGGDIPATSENRLAAPYA